MKPFWKSRTAIVAIVGIIVGAGASIARVVTGTEVLGFEEQAAVVTVIVSAVALALRFITNEPIGL